MDCRTAWTWLASLALLAAPSLAQNLLTNPSFDSDLAGWNVTQGSASWSLDDANSAPGSGSARLTTPTVEVNSAIIRQCVEAAGGADYAFGVKHSRPLPNKLVSAFGAVAWYASVGCDDDFLLEETPIVSFSPGADGWETNLVEVTAPAEAQSARITLRARREEAEAGVLQFDDALFAPAAACIEDAVTLCLADNRFRVRVFWRSRQTAGAFGSAVRLTQDSGYYWFFNEENVEIVLKVLDACSTPSHKFWVFAAGLTNVEVEVEVVDTETQEERLYLNPLDQPFQPIQDTLAFDTCP